MDIRVSFLCVMQDMFFQDFPNIYDVTAMLVVSVLGAECILVAFNYKRTHCVNHIHIRVSFLCLLQDMVPKAELESLMEQHNAQLMQIQDEYE